jgi:hypothetical protein
MRALSTLIARTLTVRCFGFLNVTKDPVGAPVFFTHQYRLTADQSHMRQLDRVGQQRQQTQAERKLLCAVPSVRRQPIRRCPA